MAEIYPDADFKPLGAQSQRGMLSHDIACLHTMVGYLISTDRYFRISNGDGFRGTESHFGMGGKWGPDLGGDLDGKVWQWQDIAFSADANLDGWHRVISMETADNGGPQADDIPPWTPKQVHSLAKWLAWVCSIEAHRRCPSSWACRSQGIPLVLIPDTKPGRRGVGYHRQGIDPWRVSGGEKWSGVAGKECPTDPRIAQIPGIIELARSISEGGTVSAEEVWSASRKWQGWHLNLEPDLEEKWKDGLSYGRMVQDVFVRSRHTSSYAYMRDVQGRAIWFNKNDKYGISHSKMLRRCFEMLNELLPQVTANTAILSSLVDRNPSVPLTGEEIESSVRKAIEASVVKVDVSVTGTDLDDPDGLADEVAHTDPDPQV